MQSLREEQGGGHEVVVQRMPDLVPIQSNDVELRFGRRHDECVAGCIDGAVAGDVVSCSSSSDGSTVTTGLRKADAAGADNVTRRP